MTMVICLLVRPVRTWIDRAAVDIATGGSASVDQLKLHFGESVIEAQRFETHRSVEGRRFGLVADKAWVALDPVDLVDRIYTSPAVLVEGAEVYLEDSQPAKLSPNKISWEARLAEKLAGVSWEELCRHLQSVLTVDDLAGRLQSRITQLIDRSEDIIRQSREITNEKQERDNPLRYEDDVRRRLAKVDQLRSRQIELLEQFETTYRLLSAETKQLEEKYAAESERIRAEALAAAAVKADMQGLADDVLKTAGVEAWKMYSPMAEIVYRLSEVAPADTASKHQRPWNRSFRRPGLTLVSLPNIRAAGNFRLGRTVTPFHLAGSYRAQANGSGVSNWSCDFFKAGQFVNVVVDGPEAIEPQGQDGLTAGTGVPMGDGMFGAVDSLSVESTIAKSPTATTAIENQIAQTTNATAPNGRTLPRQLSVIVKPQADEEAGLEATALLTAELVIDGETVSGTMRVARDAFDLVEYRREAQILSAALARLERPDDGTDEARAYVEYRLSGTWMSPSVTPNSPAERWLLDHVRECLEPELENALAVATASLEESLQDQLNRLRGSTRQVADASMLLRDENRNPVYTARARLQSFLDELNGTAIRR